MSQPRILVACVGNIFLGDDAFGVEVARRLLDRPIPVGVRVIDFGIRGLDLTYALLDGYDAVIIVDALPRGEPPGTVCILEPDPADVSAGPPMIEGHNLDPIKVLRLATAMGGRVRRLLVVGCEPEPLADADDMRMGLSAAVHAAVDEAVAVVEALVAEILTEPLAV